MVRYAVSSVIAEALHFGAARMAMTARLAWAPVILLFFTGWVGVFVTLSVIAGQPVTLADLQSFFQAAYLAESEAARGWSARPVAMASVIAVTVIVQWILTASFMAPLIRYAALGERPTRLTSFIPFGPAQLRFVAASAVNLGAGAAALAPVFVAGFFVMRSLLTALGETIVTFPDAGSLHTIDVTLAGQALASGAEALPEQFLSLSNGLAIALWLALAGVAAVHFWPTRRAAEGEAASETVGGSVLGGVVLVLLLAVASLPLVWTLQTYLTAGAGFFQQTPGFVEVGPAAVAAMLSAAAPLAVYAYARFIPYPGLATASGGLAPHGLFELTRRWNLFRLIAVLVALLAIVTALQFLVNAGLSWTGATVNALYGAVDVAERLTQSGAKSAWVRPLFVWIWNFTVIAANLAWAFFSYGVLAGLYGRLAREAARAPVA